MRILFAPDSFKGSLSAGAVCALLEEQAGLIFPGCETISLPMADGDYDNTRAAYIGGWLYILSDDETGFYAVQL